MEQFYRQQIEIISFFYFLKGALQFLENYAIEDITVAQLEGSSNSLWTISPPSRKNMIKELKADDPDFSLVISWNIQRYIIDSI